VHVPAADGAVTAGQRVLVDVGTVTGSLLVSTGTDQGVGRRFQRLPAPLHIRLRSLLVRPRLKVHGLALRYGTVPLKPLNTREPCSARSHVPEHAAVEPHWPPLWVEPDTPVDTLAILMREHEIGAIPIGENDRLVGMVTDRDIVCRCIGAGLDPKTEGWWCLRYRGSSPRQAKVSGERGRLQPRLRNCTS
jgi:hypothetical protein